MDGQNRDQKHSFTLHFPRLRSQPSNKEYRQDVVVQILCSVDKKTKQSKSKARPVPSIIGGVSCIITCALQSTKPQVVVEEQKLYKEVLLKNLVQ